MERMLIFIAFAGILSVLWLSAGLLQPIHMSFGDIMTYAVGVATGALSFIAARDVAK